MKKILTILTVALLACSTVFAAVNLSGEFEAGYKFSFKDEFKADPQDNAEGKVTVKVSDDAGIWTVNVKALDSLDSSNKLKANLSLNLAALMAANGVDLGDVSLALSLGANERMTALSAYNDVTGDELYKFKNDGKYSTELAVGYGDLIQTKIAVDPKVGGKFALVASALTKPVDGVAVSVAYAHNAWFDTPNGVLGLLGQTVPTGVSVNNIAKNGVSIAADINVGTLAGLDFDLGVTVYDNIGFDAGVITSGEDEDGKTVTEIAYFENSTFNTFAAAVYGGVDFIDAFFEFRMDNIIPKEGEGDTVCGMKSQINFNVVENLGLDVYFNIGDFEAFDTTYSVGGDVSYTVSGVKFAANLDYAAVAGFSITPKIVVTF